MTLVLAKLFYAGSVVNILSFVGHMVSVATPQLQSRSGSSRKQHGSKMPGCIPIHSSVQNTSGKLDVAYRL